jgi:hypothetical protein
MYYLNSFGSLLSIKDDSCPSYYSYLQFLFFQVLQQLDILSGQQLHKKKNRKNKNKVFVLDKRIENSKDYNNSQLEDRSGCKNSKPLQYSL